MFGILNKIRRYSECTSNAGIIGRANSLLSPCLLTGLIVPPPPANLHSLVFPPAFLGPALESMAQAGCPLFLQQAEWAGRATLSFSLHLAVTGFEPVLSPEWFWKRTPTASQTTKLLRVSGSLSPSPGPLLEPLEPFSFHSSSSPASFPRRVEDPCFVLEVCLPCGFLLQGFTSDP